MLIHPFHFSMHENFFSYVINFCFCFSKNLENQIFSKTYFPIYLASMIFLTTFHFEISPTVPFSISINKCPTCFCLHRMSHLQFFFLLLSINFFCRDTQKHLGMFLDTKLVSKNISRVYSVKLTVVKLVS